MTKGDKPSHTRGKKVESKGSFMDEGKHYGRYEHKDITNCCISNLKHPTSILSFPYYVNNSEKYHPSQKPIELLEWLIRTYTNERETVLDNCMGSGSTGVACINTSRNFIGIEKEEKYYEVAKNRLENSFARQKCVGLTENMIIKLRFYN